MSSKKLPCIVQKEGILNPFIRRAGGWILRDQRYQYWKKMQVQVAGLHTYNTTEKCEV